ncbi:MAG: hypothetical protein Q8M06_09890 [Methanobacteriaceae archaeon]|nr:hypothetical protein [Methanobacteriaceae archaeon]
MKKIYKSATLPENLDSTQRMGVIITFSFSTMDLEMARIFEPYPVSPKKT